jgi:hypothetical protein
MALSIEKVIHNLHFDRLFLDRIEVVERQNKEQLHGNGVPFHYVSVFKLLLVLPKHNSNQHKISFYYHEIFGRHITQPSLSRTLDYLANKLGLVKVINDRLDARKKEVELTPLGKKFQQHLVGSTSVAKEIDKDGKLRSVVINMPIRMSNERR